MEEVWTQVWIGQKPSTRRLLLRSLTVVRVQHRLVSLGGLEGDWSFFSRFATGLFGNYLVFCLDEFHEGSQILRGLEGEACPSSFPDLVAQAPVDRLVFGETKPRLEVGVEGCAHLASSQVEMVELAAFIEESWGGFAAVFLVQDFHRNAFQLSHASSECLEERPCLWVDAVCYHGKIEGFFPRQVWNAWYPDSTKKG